MLLNQTGIQYGNGTYELYYSTTYQGTYRPGSYYFNKNTEYAGFAFNRYNMTTGKSVVTSSIVSGSTGDWIIVRFPSPIILTGYSFTRNYAVDMAPAAWKIYGSNSLSGFTEIVNASKAFRLAASDYDSVSQKIC